MADYDKHPCPRLVEAFKGYQGQEPGAARFVFMGLDANFSRTIEGSPVFPEVLQYLSMASATGRTKKTSSFFVSGIREGK